MKKIQKKGGLGKQILHTKYIMVSPLYRYYSVTYLFPYFYRQTQDLVSETDLKETYRENHARVVQDIIDFRHSLHALCPHNDNFCEGLVENIIATMDSYLASKRHSPGNNKDEDPKLDTKPLRAMKIGKCYSSSALKVKVMPENGTDSYTSLQDLTILINAVGLSTPDKLNNMLRSLSEMHRNGPSPIKVLLGISTDLHVEDDMHLKYTNSLSIKKKMFKNSASHGYIWNSLVKEVKTQNTLIVPNMGVFSKDTNLTDLLSPLIEGVAAVIGGAIIDKNRHWSLGCELTKYINFTLMYENTYTSTSGNCMKCDFIHGMFVIRTTEFLKFPLDENLAKGSVFHDFFLRCKRAGITSIVCPTVIFEINNDLVPNSDKNIWLPLVKKWSLNQLTFAGRLEMKFTCKQINVNCAKLKGSKGLLLPRCCLEELSELVQFVSKTCIKHNLYCVADTGTLLGAIKFNSILPWEVDADMGFALSNLTAYRQLGSYYKKWGYLLKEFHTNPNGASFVIYSKSWSCDAWGTKKIDPETRIDPSNFPVPNGWGRTKILLDGEWVPTNTNPGLYARQMFYNGMLQHEEHSGGGILKFFTCPRTGDHACLDQYSADGSIQFQFSRQKQPSNLHCRLF